MEKAGWGLLRIVVGGVFGCLFLALVATLCCVNAEDGTPILIAGMLGIVFGPTPGCLFGITAGQHLNRKLQNVTSRYKAGFVTTLLIGVVGIDVILAQSILHFATPPTDAQLIAHLNRYESELKSPIIATDQRGMIFLNEEASLESALGKLHKDGTQPLSEIRFVPWRNRLDISAYT